MGEPIRATLITNEALDGMLAEAREQGAREERERLRALPLAAFLHGLWSLDAPWHNALVTKCDPLHHAADARHILDFLLANPAPPLADPEEGGQ